MNYERLYADIMLKLKEELPKTLYYHGQHHTIDVLASITQICQAEGVGGQDLILLKSAALLHDIGFTVNAVNHEHTGCEIARNILPDYDYTTEQIEAICGMIMATKIPQTPNTKLEEIICDADLDYLGRNDFYAISNSLFRELQTRGVIDNENEWNKIQVKFLLAHHYFTATNIKNREGEKQKRIEELKEGIVD